MFSPHFQLESFHLFYLDSLHPFSYNISPTKCVRAHSEYNLSEKAFRKFALGANALRISATGSQIRLKRAAVG